MRVFLNGIRRDSIVSQLYSNLLPTCISVSVLPSSVQRSLLPASVVLLGNYFESSLKLIGVLNWVWVSVFCLLSWLQLTRSKVHSLRWLCSLGLLSLSSVVFIVICSFLVCSTNTWCTVWGGVTKPQVPPSTFQRRLFDSFVLTAGAAQCVFNGRSYQLGHVLNPADCTTCTCKGDPPVFRCSHTCIDNGG